MKPNKEVLPYMGMGFEGNILEAEEIPAFFTFKAYYREIKRNFSTGIFTKETLSTIEYKRCTEDDLVDTLFKFLDTKGFKRDIFLT